MEPVPGEETSQIADLISSTDLKSLLLSFSPGAEREITQIEKGVQNFFMFHQSPRALVKLGELKILSEPDLNSLESKQVLVIGHYLEYNDEERKLTLQKVAIRPASLKGEQIDRILRACVRTGLSSVLRFIRHRDFNLLEQERSGQLGPQMRDHLLIAPESLRDRTDFVQQLGRLESVSLENLLESETEAPREYIEKLVGILARPQQELRAEMELEKEKFQENYELLDQRPERSVAFRLPRDFHVVYPPGYAMVDFDDDSFQERITEPEWIHRAYLETAGRLIRFLLPENDVEMGELGAGYHTELSRHPSFTAGESWPGGLEFLEAFGRLIQLVQNLRKMRAEVLLGFVYRQTLKMLNMRFEPIHFTQDTFQPPESVAQRFSDKNRIYESVLSRFQRDPEVLVSMDRRAEPPGAFLIFRTNLARAFIKGKDRRSFLHVLAKEGGMAHGIYDALIDINLPGLDTETLSEQRELTEAIKKWEDDLEKERKKRDRKGFFARLADWLIALFSLFSAPSNENQKRRKEDRSSQEQEDFQESEESANRKSKSSRGPRGRTQLVPPNVARAAAYVERANHGLIWLDDVVKALASVKFDMNNTGDILYYDQQERYEEIRPLIKHRRVFIRRQNLDNAEWLSNTASWLENMTNAKEEHALLAVHLRHRLDDLDY